MRKLLFFVSLFSRLLNFSQTHEIDSLKLRLKESVHDTIRVIDLNELGWQYLDYSVDSSGKYVQLALELSKKIEYLNGVIDAKNAKGILYRYTNEPEKAIKLYDEVISLRKEQGRLDKLTGAYSNLGSVYFEKGDNTNALLYYKKSFDNATLFKQTENQLIILNNIGSAYKGLGLTDLAIETFRNGIALNKTLKDEFQEAQFNVNLGTIYQQQGLYVQANKSYNDAYLVFKKTNSMRALSIVVNNLSITLRRVNDLKRTEEILKEMQEIADYLKEDDYYAALYQSRAAYYIARAKLPEALKEISFSLSKTDSINDLLSYCDRLLLKSDIYNKLHDYEKALYYCDKASQFVNRLDDKHVLANSYDTKSNIYQNMGDYKSALRYYQLSKNIDDSLDTDAFNTKMATLNSLNELDKKETQLRLSQQETETMTAKNKQQSFFLIGSIMIGFLVLVLLLFRIRAYRIKKKDNELLNKQKQEIEKQKLLIEEKQKEILDSIHYAERIQKTLLANHSLITKNLPENFILFKPKDIVSGDFYWASEKEDCFYLAVCDSTGHGVPGAFMSLLNISFLNEAINEKNIKAPNEVLNHVRQKLIDNVSHQGAKDGMDCILMRFDKKSKQITYAAAQNKVLVIRDGQLIQYLADKMPVGKGELTDSFTLRTIESQKGDLIYLYSDGYADQFGGPKSKKFKYAQLHQNLLQHSALSMPEQAKSMNKVFENWKGSLEQVDDVVLVGIRIA
ncbi:hypothetical protein CNR22_09505 [Sphingobacteriaceae bacterium]|nr:hypothetical protein CNR22_09505 [Sphingobacteriaceae bacterium]